jgi:hypothetical protein
MVWYIRCHAQLASTSLTSAPQLMQSAPRTRGSCLCCWQRAMLVQLVERNDTY